jgi:hypothetical protein
MISQASATTTTAGDSELVELEPLIDDLEEQNTEDREFMADMDQLANRRKEKSAQIKAQKEREAGSADNPPPPAVGTAAAAAAPSTSAEQTAASGIRPVLPSISLVSDDDGPVNTQVAQQEINLLAVEKAALLAKRQAALHGATTVSSAATASTSAEFTGVKQRRSVSVPVGEASISGRLASAVAAAAADVNRALAQKLAGKSSTSGGAERSDSEGPIGQVSVVYSVCNEFLLLHLTL